MRTAKVILLLLVVGGATIAAREVVQSIRIKPAKPVAEKPQIQVVSAIPSRATGRYDLSDVQLLNDNQAWAVGYDGEHTDRLYHSLDAGQTWAPVSVPGTGFTFKALHFVDSRHGWAVGGYGLIISTTDGGASWHLMKQPTKYDLTAVHFVNARVGFVGGVTGIRDKITDEMTGSVEILRTTDGGESWRRCYFNDEPLNFFQILARSESNVFAVLGGNQLIRTDDQGQTWQTVPLSVKYVSWITFNPDGSGWLVGSHGTFQTSSDGGESWHRPLSLNQEFANREWWAVAFNGNGVGLAVGDNSTLALTTDNGKTWELQR